MTKIELNELKRLKKIETLLGRSKRKKRKLQKAIARSEKQHGIDRHSNRRDRSKEQLAKIERATQAVKPFRTEK